MKLKHLTNRVTKIALCVVVSAIIITLVSFRITLPEGIPEAFVLGALCISTYLLGLLHANRITGESHDVNKEKK